MKKISIKVLLVLSLVLATSLVALILYVNSSGKKMVFEEAFSAADSINVLAFDSITALMSLKTPDFNVKADSVHNFILEIMKKHNDRLLELRLIHRTSPTGTFQDKDVAAPLGMKGAERLGDEKERLALAGTETRDTPTYADDGKTVRTVRRITPLRAEKRCLLCHQVNEGEAIAAISTYVSVELAFQKLKRRTTWNSILLSSGFFLIMAILFLFLHRMVSRPLRKMSVVAQNIAENGDLSQTLDVKSSDEIGELATSFNRMIESLREGRLEIIHRLARSAEYRDEETGQHVQRTSLYAAALARRMGFDEGAVESVFYATPMHDLGKIGIPDFLLLKPGKLDPAELEIMKQHPVIGAQILKNSKVHFIKMAEKIAMTHHERWDGSGYPRGLKGEDIPIEGQIVAIADVFDALTSKRPYRKKPFSTQEAFAIMREMRGTHYNPELLDIFLSLEDEIIKIKEAHHDEEASSLPRIALALGRMPAMEG